MDCNKCGNQIVEDSIFCNRCGSRITPAHINNLGAAGIFNRAMTILYGLAIVTCFICNLATEQTLSWFYIVLSAIALAYSITNIPFMVKKYKTVTAGLFATAAIYVLLFVCNWFVRGNWLFKIAYPIAAVSLLFAWAILFICFSRHINWMVKSALISLLAGAATITINLMCNYLLGEPVRIYDYMSPAYWPPAAIGNKIVFICCLSYSVIALVINPILNIRKTKHL